MKFSIGLRLFLTVLLSIFCVAIIVLIIMSERVTRNFNDYATKIELNRLEEITDVLQAKYTYHQDWSFLPDDPAGKENWIIEVLLQLQEDRIQRNGSIESKDSVDSIEHKIPNVDTNFDAMLPPLLPSTVPPEPPQPPAPPEPAAPPTQSAKLQYLTVPPLPTTIPMTKGRKKINIGVNNRLHEINNGTNNRTNNQPIVLPSLFRRITLLDQNFIYLAGRPIDPLPSARRSLKANGKIIAYLQITQSNLPTDEMAREFLQVQTSTITTIILVSILLSAITASLLAIHFKKPILRLVEGARLLAKGRYDTQLSENRSDELGELAHSFNQLAKQLNQAEHNRRQWVADTSHELRTPISVLRAQLEAIQDGIRPVNPDNIALMLRQVLSLNKLIDELYALARADVGELSFNMRKISLWDLVIEESNNFQEKLDAAQLTLRLYPMPTRILINADSERIRQVLYNLLENSIRYTNAGGSLEIHIQESNKQIILTMDDTSPSVPDEALSKLSQRFYRVDASRDRQHGGTGLGLALCSRIMQAHQGEIIFTHSNLGGLCVQLLFPISSHQSV